MKIHLFARVQYNTYVQYNTIQCNQGKVASIISAYQCCQLID